jgi:hypothetical protein
LRLFCNYLVAAAGAEASAGAEAAGAVVEEVEAAGVLDVASAGAAGVAGAAAAGAGVSAAGAVAAGGVVVVVVVVDVGASSFLPHAARATASWDEIRRLFFMDFPQKLLSKFATDGFFNR